MIEIKWKGKIGYGDIVSPICYAHNVSFKLQTKVNLVFYWAHGSEQKVYSVDPETLWYRADYLNNICCKTGTDVSVTHKFDTQLHINHTNYDWKVVSKDEFHNFWFPRDIYCHSKKLIVVNSTTGNIQSLQDYGKPWKDPIADQWDNVIDQISNLGFFVEVVDNRTPIDHLVYLLKTAKGFVGYHGTAAWPAKLLQVPSILFSCGGNLSRGAFPAAHIRKSIPTSKFYYNFEWFVEYAARRVNQTLLRYATYKPNQQFINHLTYE